MSNTMSVCSGGACRSFYVSTLSTFFSAFGIPIFEYLHYLNFVAVLFIGINLFSMYTIKKSLLYVPFFLSLFGSILVLTDMFIIDLDYLTYIGNFVIILAAILNIKMRKKKF